MTLEVTDIMEILPHRYPMLLVDRIIELEPMKYAIGIKNATINAARKVNTAIGFQTSGGKSMLLPISSGRTGRSLSCTLPDTEARSAI